MTGVLDSDAVVDKDVRASTEDALDATAVPSPGDSVTSSPATPVPASAPYPAAMGGSFHPDFLYCGSCVTCQEDKKDGADVGGSVDSETGPNRLPDNTKGHMLRSEFRLLDRQQQQQQEEVTVERSTDPTGVSNVFQEPSSSTVLAPGSVSNAMPKSHRLVVESMIRPLLGVSRVHTPSVSTVVVLHDSQTSVERILHVLESIGHMPQHQRTRTIEHDTNGPPHKLHHQAYLSHGSATVSNNSINAGADTEDEARHDSQTRQRHPSDAADSVHAPANDGSNAPVWVKSTFAVQGICCASEIPAIRSITKQHMPQQYVRSGSLVQINLTTKHVYVQHDRSALSAQKIASIFTKQGFPAQLVKEGKAHSTATSATDTATTGQRPFQTDTYDSIQIGDRRGPQQSVIGRTTLHAKGVLVQQDIGPIQSALKDRRHHPTVDADDNSSANASTNDIVRIGVNVSEGVVLVDHDVTRITSVEIMQMLYQNAGYSTKVVLAGEDIVKGQHATESLWNAMLVGHSKYVESTVVLSHAPEDAEDSDSAAVSMLHRPDILSIVERTVSQNYVRAQVRAVYKQNSTSFLSQYNDDAVILKIEHNPDLLSVQNIVDTIIVANANLGLSCQVAVDGSVDGLYLPLQEEFMKVNDNDNHRALADHHSQMRLTVLISGMFWILSILSFFGDEWEWFKYFGLGAVAFGMPPIAVKAWRTLKRHQFDANVMMCIAAVGAVLLGEFDEAASVAFLFSISEWLEARASSKARDALYTILQLRPDHATVIHPTTKQLMVVPADKVPLGAILSVKTGDKIAADGVVLEGSSAVNESSLTGESRPAHKQAGDVVRGGTINVGSSQLVVQTTSTVDDSVVSRLVQLIEEAQSNQSATEQMIDTFARSYTPTIVLLAALMCSMPWFWGVEAGRYWTLNGLIIIVIACPCALTISTPVTYAAGLAAAAQRGIIVKSGACLEAMGFVETVVFDKTGTLTIGQFSVLELQAIGNKYTRRQMLELLAMLQGRSSHPLSSTLVEAAQREGVSPPKDWTITDHHLLKGEGVSATINGQAVYAGNERLFGRLGMTERLSEGDKRMVQSWSESGSTVGFLGTHEDGIIGAFGVTDAIRDEAEAAVSMLREYRIDTIMCTGDSQASADSVADVVRIPQVNVYSQLLPEDKLHIVGRLKRPQPKSFGLCRGHRFVAFCGDGVNDGPALAVADIGISMGEGAAVAMEVSDITLMDSNLLKLPYMIHTGRRVVRTIKENIFISLFAKLAVVGLTFTGKMTLLMAIAADVGIMLLVTVNGMKLLPSVDGSSHEAVQMRVDSHVCAKKVEASFELASTSDNQSKNRAELV